MRKTIFSVSAVVVLSALCYGLATPEPEAAKPNLERRSDAPIVKESHPEKALSLEEQLVHKILLQDNNDALSQAYGNTLLMVDREHKELTTRTLHGTNKQRNFLTDESRAYFPVADAHDFDWASQLRKQGFLQEAFYHYWMLERSLLEKGDPKLKDIQSQRKDCERSLSFFPKGPLSAKEKSDKNRIGFFLSDGRNGMVEIDPQAYGIPKSVEEKFYAAFKAQENKQWQEAGDLFAQLIKQLTPKSAAYDEALWRRVQLDHKLGRLSTARVLELTKSLLNLRPDILCERLTKDIRSKYMRDYAQSPDQLPETIEYAVELDERGYWRGRAFTAHGLAPLTSKSPHTALPKRTHYNYRSALRDKQKKVLKALETLFPKLTKETVKSWRLLGNQYIRIGDFSSASLVFLKLESITKNERDAFKSVACQIRSSVETESAQPALRMALLEQYKIYHPGAFQSSLVYLEGQIAFQAKEWKKARECFASLLGTKSPEARGSEFYCALLDRQILRLQVPQSLSETGGIKVKVTRRNIREIRFRFLKVEDALVLRKGSERNVTRQIQEFFANQKSKALKCESEKVHSFAKLNYGQIQFSELSLKLPGEGVWVVEAVAGSLSTKFIAIHQTTQVFGMQFPESSLLVFESKKGESISDLAVFSQTGQFLGKTDDKGALVTPLARDLKGAKNPVATVYCSKPGHYFKTSVSLHKRVLDKATHRAGTRLYVYTDRPLYQAGETLSFKGVIRHDKLPSKRSPEGRYSVAKGEEVKVLIKQKSRVIFSKSLVSNEFGAFHGSYQFPKNAARKKYTVEVHYQKVVARAGIELRDLNKPSYSIHYTAKETGFQIFAGYSWGMPVPGAALECFVGKKLVPLSVDKDGFVFLKLSPGDRVSIGLKKGKEVLLVKARTFSPPKRYFALKPTKKSAEKGSLAKANPKILKKASPRNAAVTKSQPEFQLVLEKSFDPKSRTIVLKLSSLSKKPWSAWIALGDTAAFDFRKIQSKGPAKLVPIPVTRACDPCIYAHVRFERGKLIQKEQLRIPVRAALLQVEVETDRELYKPGDSVRFDFWTKGLSGFGVAAEASLAVVDEVIFSLKDDETPDIYDFFYSDRGTDCHFERFTRPCYQSQDVFVKGELKLTQYEAVNIEQKFYALFLTVVDAYGVGGGAYGGRGGRVRMYGCSVACSAGVESASHASLRWLANHQSGSGIWDNARFMNNCEKGGNCQLTGPADLNLMTTALALQSFTNTGHTQRFGKYKKTVARGLKALLRAQKSDGSLGLENQSRFAFLNHLSGTFALSEAYACSRDFKLKNKAQKALDFVIERQIKGSGWGFNKSSKQANMLMTAWAVHGLRAGKSAGLKVPDRVFDEALSFVDSVTDSRGWTWFETIGEEAPDWFGNKSQFVDYPEWTAMGLFVRLAAKQSSKSPVFIRGLTLLQENCPDTTLTHSSVNFQYFYFASFVMFQSRLPRADWSSFASSIQMAQQLSGCADGTWNFGGRWGKLYGRVGSTAMAAWTLNIYQRYSRGNSGSLKQPIVRLHFPDTAYWNPKIRTNRQGQFSGGFKLPDTIGAFRLTGRGITKDTDVGQVVKWIRVRKDFFVRLHCPKFIYRGDICQIRADLFNYQGQLQKIEVRLTGKGFRCQSDSLFSLKSIGNGAPQTVSWTLHARSSKELNVVVKARCGQLSDAIALTIPVRIFGETKTEYSKRLLEKETEFELEVLKEAAPGSQSLRMLLRPKSSVFFDIFETLDFLVQFPYGCVEQTMSRFLPAVEVGDSFKQLGLPIDKFVKRFDSVTEKGVKRLAGFQKPNGSWGWFASDAPNPFMTAYVVYGLSRAQKAGVTLDKRMIKRGCAYLKTVVKEQTNNDLKSFIYFALQSAGQGDLTEARSLLDAPLSSYAKALLTLTLIRSGDRPAAEKLLKRLENDRIDSGGLSHFSTPKWFYRWENVSIETSAFALLAFLEVNPKHEIVPKLKDWLISKRQGKRWKTTKDSAAAVFGLIKFVALNAKENGVSGENVFRRTLTVTLNGKTTRTVVIDLSNPLESQFECVFDAQDLKRGKNRIKVSGAVSSILCQSSLTYVKALREIKAKANGLTLSSDWDKNARDLKVGDEVTVTVHISSPRDYNYLMINVPIPAGAVVDRKSARGVFAEFEARHDQGIFFLTDLKAGQHQLQFKFKCKFAGRYRVGGARGELMYSPDINGYSESKLAHMAEK